MKHLHFLLFSLSIILFPSSSLIAQNADSVRAYMLEFIDPGVNVSIMYGTGSLSLEYIEQAPLAPATIGSIEEQKREYERTNDPLALYQIAQTYRRMNLHSESEQWTQRALDEIESLMEKYPDSIELIETAFLVYIDTGQPDIAAIAAKMISDHYQNSDKLFAEALAYTFTGQHTEGIAVCNRGLLLYPGEARWYLTRIVHDFTQKMSMFGFGTPEYNAKENRLDRTFLTEGFGNFPDSLEVELVSVLGDFFLFAYEEIMPTFYEQLSDNEEVEGFEFALGKSLNEKLDVYLQKVTKMSKRKAFKNWHAIHYTLGVMQMFRSELEKAVEHFEKAISLMKPKYRQGQDNVYHYYDNLMTCYRIMGDMTSAERCAVAKATEEINIDPVPDYYIEMALYRAMNKDFDAAISILDKTIAIDSSAINAFTKKAILLMISGKTDQAESSLSSALSINPDDLGVFKAIVFFNLLKKDSVVENQINHLEAYDPTDTFIQDVRHLMKTE